MSESPEARARQRAHELLKGVCLDVDGRAVIGHARVCDGIAAELLRLEAEAEVLRRERDEARERANMRFDEATTYLQQWQRDAGELRVERDAALRSNAELRGMLAEAVGLMRGNASDYELVEWTGREDVQRACATGGTE